MIVYRDLAERESLKIIILSCVVDRYFGPGNLLRRPNSSRVCRDLPTVAYPIWNLSMGRCTLLYNSSLPLESWHGRANFDGQNLDVPGCCNVYAVPDPEGVVIIDAVKDDWLDEVDSLQLPFTHS